jgi:hypothetical protein
MDTKPKTMHARPPEDAFAFLADDEAEAFGEEFVATATSGEFIGEDARNEIADEELGLIEIRPMFDDEEAEAS